MAQIAVPDIALGFDAETIKPLGAIGADPPKGVYSTLATTCTYENSKGMPRLNVGLAITGCLHAMGEGAENAGGGLRLTLWLPTGKDAEKDKKSLRRIAQVWVAAGREPSKLEKAKLPQIVAALASSKIAFAVHFIPRDPNVRGDNPDVQVLTPDEVKAVQAGALVINKFVKTKAPDAADDLGDAEGGDGTGDDEEKPAKPAAKPAAAAKPAGKAATAAILDDDDDEAPASTPAKAPKTATKAPPPPADDDDPLA